MALLQHSVLQHSLVYMYL